MTLIFQSMIETIEQLNRKEVTIEDVLSATYERIRETNTTLRAFIEWEKVAPIETPSPLKNIPLGIKDMLDVKGMLTTYGSPLFATHRAKKSSDVAKRLKQAGGIIVGKQNTHQFAYGPTGDRSHFGAVRNPFDLQRMTGGSSSGSAAAVAAGLVYGSIGTDTSGSIRLPAAFTGLVGMKPTQTSISHHGVFPLAPSLDHIGPLTRTVRDNALLLSIIQKRTFPLPRRSISSIVVGRPTNYFTDFLSPSVKRSYEELFLLFERLGMTILPMELPSMNAWLEAQQVMIQKEAFTIHENRFYQYPNDWDDEVYARLEKASTITTAMYEEALQYRKRAAEEARAIFETVDIFFTPTVPITAPLINERTTDSDEFSHIREVLTRFTAPTNFISLPSMNIPIGRDGHLPIGGQLIAAPFQENLLYQVGEHLEKELAFDWSKYLKI